LRSSVERDSSRGCRGFIHPRGLGHSRRVQVATGSGDESEGFFDLREESGNEFVEVHD